MSTLAITLPRGAARRIEAARRRATDARHKATRRPTEANLDRAQELEAGLAAMEAGTR